MQESGKQLLESLSDFEVELLQYLTADFGFTALINKEVTPLASIIACDHLEVLGLLKMAPENIAQEVVEISGQSYKVGQFYVYVPTAKARLMFNQGCCGNQVN